MVNFHKLPYFETIFLQLFGNGKKFPIPAPDHALDPQKNYQKFHHFFIQK